VANLEKKAMRLDERKVVEAVAPIRGIRDARSLRAPFMHLGWKS
jgi:hypothetical protein